MSIATELDNYRIFLKNAYDKCEEKGAIIPSHKNLQNLTVCIDTLLDRQTDVVFVTEDELIILTESRQELDTEIGLYIAENDSFILSEEGTNWEVE